MSVLGNSSDPHLAAGGMASSSPADSVLSAIAAVLPAVSTWMLIGSMLLAIVIYDQIVYQLNKKGIAGPRFKIPIMGAFLDSLNPTFDGYLKKWESGPLSCVAVFHKFVVIAPTRDLARRIFNSPAFVQPCVVDAGKKILKHTNWVFLDGKAHIDYRKGLNGLFNRKALGGYIPGQEEVYDQSFDDWVAASKAAGKHIPFFSYFREINVAVACRTFAGEYISKEAVHEISLNYWRITAAMELVNFPLVLPYTKIWYGIQARKLVEREFEACAAKSRVRMLNKEPITCMMDAWIRSMIDAQEYAALPPEKKAGSEEPAPTLIRDFTDTEISLTFISFLFASQDATSSAIIWLFQYLADNPEMLAKVREEQLAVRDGDRNKRLDLDMAEKMEYTRWCVKESLRMRPPVLMVPYQAKKDFPITPEYTVPKGIYLFRFVLKLGAMVIPTLWHSLHDETIYPDPFKFNPLRWAPDGIAEQNHKNWLVFGCGPHVCLGQNYAIMHLVMCLGKASLFLDWDHKVTDVSDDIRIFATIFPQDDCLLMFKRRD